MGKLAVRTLRAVLVMVLAGTVCVQAGMVWVLVSGSDPEDGSLPLTALRVITILGMLSGQVALVSVWRLVTMVRRGTVFSHAAFRYVDAVIGAVSEAFNSVLKVEYVHRHAFATRAAARIRIATWITDFYNSRRLHSMCGFKSPIDHEQDYWASLGEGPAA